MENIRNCPLCNSPISYSSNANFQRANNKNSSCKSCSNFNKWNPESREKASNSRKEYLRNLTTEEKLEMFKKTSETNKKNYLSKSEEWKKNWSNICSSTSAERWSDPEYKKRLKKSLSENNWTKREDAEEIKERQVKTRIEKNNGVYNRGPGRCKEFILNGIKCYGNFERKYIEILIKEGQKLPCNIEKSIKTEFGSYTPDFEFEDFYVDVKCNFTYDVLMGKKSYSKKRDSNPKQLKKMKWISGNLKKIKIAIIDGESLKYIDL